MNISQLKVELFQRTCWRGNLNEAKNIFENDKELFCKIIPFQQLFTITCSFGHLDVVKWLFEINQLFFASKSLPIYCNITLPEILKHSFTNSCISGHLNVCKWLLEKMDIYHLQCNIQTVFSETCCNGKIKVAKWIWNLFANYINVSFSSVKIARIAVINKHRKMFKWILSIYPNWNITQTNTFLIGELFSIGNNLSFLKWLQNNRYISNVNCCGFEDSLKWMIEKKNLFVMKYFFAEFNKLSNSNWRKLFWNCCVSKDSHFSTAKFVICRKPTILKKNNYESKDGLFCNICHNNNYRILKWMLQLEQKKYFTSIVCKKNETKIQCKKFYGKKQQISKLLVF